jgi:hypothetical protein
MLFGVTIISLKCLSSYFALHAIWMFFLMQTVPLDLFLHSDTMQQSWDCYSLLHSEKTSIRGTLLLYIILSGWSVLVTPLLTSPIFDF